MNRLSVCVLALSLGLCCQAIGQNRTISTGVSSPSSASPVAIPLPAAVTDVDVNPNTNQVYAGGNISNVV
jgi:hypothetical protein